jgi:undecaprenyl-diphosphatase
VAATKRRARGDRLVTGLLAAMALAAYLALGLVVSGAPPSAYDRSGAIFTGSDLPLATFLTNAGLFPVYVGVCVATLLFALVRRAWFGRAVLAAATLAVAWRLSDYFKDRFHRPRPEHWLVHHETSFSYASGHATLALAFYGLWAAFIWNARLPTAVRVLAVALLGLWIAGIGWSRLALEAHYPTDLLGGYLLGAACAFAALALAPRGGVRG